jgi:TonB family protein
MNALRISAAALAICCFSSSVLAAPFGAEGSAVYALGPISRVAVIGRNDRSSGTAARGTFLIVTVTANNPDNAFAKMTLNRADLLDNRGSVYDLSADGQRALLESGDRTADLRSMEMQPNTSTNVSLVFDIPVTLDHVSLMIPHTPYESSGHGYIFAINLEVHPINASCAGRYLPASVTKVATPDFPEMARQQGARGTAVVRVSLSEYGTVTDTVIERSTGFSSLDQEARKAARSSAYAPALSDCRPVPGETSFTANF